MLKARAVIFSVIAIVALSANAGASAVPCGCDHTDPRVEPSMPDCAHHQDSPSEHEPVKICDCVSAQPSVVAAGFTMADPLSVLPGHFVVSPRSLPELTLLNRIQTSDPPYATDRHAPSMLCRFLL
jgi:hypothetical protein